jgi:ribonuclease D
VRWYLGRQVERPALLDGWRAEIVGNVLVDLLGGKTAVRVVDPRSDSPLAVESIQASI